MSDRDRTTKHLKNFNLFFSIIWSIEILITGICGCMKDLTFGDMLFFVLLPTIVTNTAMFIVNIHPYYEQKYTQIVVKSVGFSLQGHSRSGEPVSIELMPDDNDMINISNLPVGEYTVCENGEYVAEIKPWTFDNYREMISDFLTIQLLLCCASFVIAYLLCGEFNILEAAILVGIFLIDCGYLLIMYIKNNRKEG